VTVAAHVEAPYPSLRRSQSAATMLLFGYGSHRGRYNAALSLRRSQSAATMLLFGYGSHRAPLQCCSFATALTERRYNAALSLRRSQSAATMLLFGYGAHRAPLQCCSLATALTERRYNAAAASGRVSKILIRCGLCFLLFNSWISDIWTGARRDSGGLCRTRLCPLL